RGLEIDWSTHQRLAPGSDNWQLTWADDGHQYAPWGDGGGFRGTNSKGRVSLGVARVEGDAHDYRGYNVWGGFEPENPATVRGKSWGIACVDGSLYMWVGPGSSLKDMQSETRLFRSDDHAATWRPAPWAFTKDDNLTIPTICQFGRDYADAPDGYAYHYFLPTSNPGTTNQGPLDPTDIYLARTLRDRIFERDAYEFFAGLDGAGQPRWTRDLTKRAPVFHDPNRVGWCLSVSFNRGLGRYILMTNHVESSRGNLGVFDAPSPWGPWTTVAYMNVADGKPFGAGHVVDNVFFANIPTKWTSADGQRFTLVFTGAGRGKNNDSWNAVRGRFVLRGSDPIK
ncbi:MAG: DUF4185 domain-containing protein, partial [Planctomycetota bacterium]